MKNIVIILSDVRSCYNVGSIFRTADGAGTSEVVCCGITPYSRLPKDSRPEKVIENNSRMIHKTALDAENSVPFSHFDSTLDAISYYQNKNFQIVALENKVPNTQDIFNFKQDSKVALVVGSETDGLEKTILDKCDATVEIPMQGIKNSLNVSVAVGVALYVLRAQI